MKETLFVTCGPHLEPLLVQELTDLGFANVRPSYRGAYVDIDSIQSIYLINYASRIASRVLLPLIRFRVYDEKTLYKGASAINWLPYITPKQTFAIDPTVQHPKFRNSLFAAQVLKDAICDQIRTQTGDRPNIDTYTPDVQLNLFIQDQMAVISFDTSGQPLHKRGYRIDAAEAPLQETLAAAILRLADYKAEEILFDPCCGSGTFLIEAAMLASKTPAGFYRQKWGFMRLSEFSPIEWLKVKNELDSKRIPLLPQHFFGCDINRNTVRICKNNLRAAGMDTIAVAQGDLRDYIPPVPPTFILTNPPYGTRMQNEADLVDLYRSLGDFFKQKGAKPSRAFIFTGNLALAKEIGLAAKRRHVLDNGGIEARLLEFNIW